MTPQPVQPRSGRALDSPKKLGVLEQRRARQGGSRHDHKHVPRGWVVGHPSAGGNPRELPKFHPSAEDRGNASETSRTEQVGEMGDLYRVPTRSSRHGGGG